MPILDHEDFFAFNGECFLVFENPKSWNDAEQECMSKKAHLVTVTDIPTQLYLLNEIKSPEAWIGLTNKKVIFETFKSLNYGCKPKLYLELLTRITHVLVG